MVGTERSSQCASAPPVHLGPQHADERKVAVALAVVEPVPHDEADRAVEPGVALSLLRDQLADEEGAHLPRPVVDLRRARRHDRQARDGARVGLLHVVSAEGSADSLFLHDVDSGGR